MSEDKFRESIAKDTVKRRIAKSNLTEEQRYSIIQDYMTSDMSTSEIAQKYSTTEKNIELIVSRHWKTLTNVRETKMLTSGSYTNDHKNGSYMALKAINRVPSINEDFLMLLSDPSDLVLTDNELQYCFNYVVTGDNLHALSEAGLTVGLMGSKSDKGRNQYQLSCRLRGHYIRQKKNVAQRIFELKKEAFLPEIIDKNFVQSELLEQLNQLKECTDSSTVRSQTLKTIELIGKSVGAFSDVIKVEEVDPGKALDYLESLSNADASLVTGTLDLLED